MRAHTIHARRLLGGVVILIAATGAGAQSIPSATNSEERCCAYSLAASLREPAVSEVNGKVGYAGGVMDSETGHNFDGSITFPIAKQFGAQADALYSRIAGEDFWGGAGHVFWRDPDVGLLGLAGGVLHREGVDTFQAGVEGAYYLGPVTIGAFAGVGSISYANSAPFIDTNPTKFIGSVSVDWYALNDLRVGVSYTTAFENNLFKGDVEYQTPVNGLALTGEIARGDHDYDHWLLGVRYYFGAKKSLRDRQRQDDPPSLMPQILHGLGLYGAEFNERGRAFVVAHPDSGILGDSYGWGLQMDIVTVPPTPPDYPLGPPLPPYPPTDLSGVIDQQPPPLLPPAAF
jgi:hypothetical protein